MDCVLVADAVFPALRPPTGPLLTGVLGQARRHFPAGW